MNTDMVTRGCALSTVPQMVDQETVCGTHKSGLEKLPSESGTLAKYSCRVETCATDFCNSQEMEKFRDEDHNKDSYVSSGTGMYASLLHIITLAGVAMYLA